MTNIIAQRLQSLRDAMRREHLAACIFPSTDPHNGEYVPARWQGREWISGFDGSAGTAVVTMDAAALWTDSRYFIAAEAQLAGSEYQLMRIKMEGTPSIASWLGKQLADSRSKEVCLYGMDSSYSTVEALIAELRAEGGLTLRTNFDPLNEIWKDRPDMPLGKVEVHPLEYAGESATDKLVRVRRELRRQHADGLLVAALDDIAWTLNLRGSDVHCTPVFVAYLLISAGKTTLFTDSRKLTPAVEAYLKKIGVQTREYGEVVSALARYPDYNIMIDPDEVSHTLAKAVRCPHVVWGHSPIPVMKAVKNEVEIRGYRSAMLKDGIAMVKFLRWLVPAVRKGGETEMTVAVKLNALRAEQPLFRDISFDTIAAYEAHGAIVHYEPTPSSASALRPEGLLLLDSGAQYVDGTTDITRTIALGPVSDDQKRVYTLVLKAHIQMELAKFPDGAAGTQIDAFARGVLWREGMNYLHGTGHGVGAYLSVHEGPHQVRMEWKPTPLRAGMTITDEPGIYLDGRFGVRVENALLIAPYKETEFGRFLQMESLTLCPIDTTPIVREMMTDEEVAWLNDYHQMVFDTLSPHLNPDEKEWLKSSTRPI